jgi:hypothetical protein
LILLLREDGRLLSSERSLLGKQCSLLIVNIVGRWRCSVTLELVELRLLSHKACLVC